MLTSTRTRDQHHAVYEKVGLQKSLSVGLKNFVIEKRSWNLSQKMVVLILKSLVKTVLGLVLMKIPVSSLSGPPAQGNMNNCHMLPTRPHVFANWPLS